MSNDPLYAWNTPLLTRKARPADPLWTMCKDGHEIAELCGHGEYGWELQLLRDGEFSAGRRFDLRAQAVAHGEEIRQDLIVRGRRAE